MRSIASKLNPPTQLQQDKVPATGRGAFIARNERGLLINKKPLFLRRDELKYGIVNGVTYTKVGLVGTVTLQTRAIDIHVRTLNLKCVDKFMAAIEAICITQSQPEYSQ